MSKKLGIIGGLGPMATVYFLQLLTSMTDAKEDQGHIPLVMESVPRTPDRTAYILDNENENPLPTLIDAGNGLKQHGAEYIAIPCVTAHYFQEELSESIGLPVINLPKRLAEYLRDRNIDKVGILATTGTVESKILQNALDEYNINVCVPDNKGQQVIMNTIYGQIKAGKSVDIDAFLNVGVQLLKEGAQCIVLGCTELSLIKRDYRHLLNEEYIDVLEVLAKAAILDGGYTLRSE